MNIRSFSTQQNFQILKMLHYCFMTLSSEVFKWIRQANGKQKRNTFIKSFFVLFPSCLKTSNNVKYKSNICNTMHKYFSNGRVFLREQNLVSQNLSTHKSKHFMRIQLQNKEVWSNCVTQTKNENTTSW